MDTAQGTAEGRVAGKDTTVGKVMAGVLLALLVAGTGFWVAQEAESSDDGVNCAVENMHRAEEGLPALACPTDF